MASVTLGKPRDLSDEERARPGQADQVNQRRVDVNGKSIGYLIGLADDPAAPQRVTSFRFEPSRYAEGDYPARTFDKLAEARKGIDAAARAATGARPPSEIHRATREEVHDAIADLESERVGSGQPTVAGLYSIVTRLLGFDPLRSKNTDTNYGGRSKDAWVNDHLSMSALRKVLDEMLDAGEIVKLNDPGRWPSTSEDKRLLRAVCFPYGLRAGYLLAETYETALDRADSDKRNARRDEILAEAKEELARLHAEELAEIYARLCTQVGLDPEREHAEAGD